MAKKKAKSTGNLHLIYGDDAYKVGAETDALIQRLAPPESRAFGFDVIDARVHTTELALEAVYRCREAVMTPGFMGSSRTVWLRDASFLGSSGTARVKDVALAVGHLAETISRGLPEEVSLVISSPSVDAKSPLLEAIKASGGKVQKHAAGKPWELDGIAQDFFEQALSERGLSAEAGVTGLFVDIAGNDLRVYDAEIEKISLCIMPRERVSKADVLTITSPLRISDGLEFYDAVGKRDLMTALAHYHRLISQKLSSFQMIVGLYGRFRQFALFVELMDSGVLLIDGRRAVWRDSGGNIARMLEDACGSDETGKKNNPMSINPYRLAILAEQARKFTASEIKKALREITDVREEFVRSRIPETLAMELLLIRLCRKAGKAPSRAPR